MSRFLLGALAMGAVFVLTSFAFRATPDPTVRKDGPAWRVSDYRLDRAFRITTVFGSNSPPITSQVPATGGFIITQVRTQPVQGSIYVRAMITVNGVTEEFRALTNQVYGSPCLFQDLNPPIIVRPNDIITLSAITDGTCDVSIGGYTTYPGET